MTSKSQVFATHEAAARARKVVDLVAVIDELAEAAGINPIEHAAHVAKLVRGFNLGHWISLARKAGCNPPSDATVELVIDVYVLRAGSRVVEVA